VIFKTGGQGITPSARRPVGALPMMCCPLPSDPDLEVTAIEAWSAPVPVGWLSGIYAGPVGLGEVTQQLEDDG